MLTSGSPRSSSRTDRGREDAEWTNPLLKQAVKAEGCVTIRRRSKRRLEVVTGTVTVVALTTHGFAADPINGGLANNNQEATWL